MDFVTGVLSTGAVWFFLSKEKCEQCAAWAIVVAFVAVVLFVTGIYLESRNMRIRRESRQSAYPVSPSTSQTTSIIRITSLDKVAVTVSATAYKANGSPIGNAGIALGTLEPNRTKIFTSADLERSLGYLPDSSPARTRVRIAFTGSLHLEIEHLLHDMRTGDSTILYLPEG